MILMKSGQEALNELLDALDVRAAMEHPFASGGTWKCKRLSDRYALRAPCIVCFALNVHSVGRLPGRTRNLSKSGIGLIVRRYFQQGDAVEVELQIPDQPRLFLAGLVGFCRYVGHSHHEIGVQLRAAARRPVFSQDLTRAARDHLWLPFAK